MATREHFSSDVEATNPLWGRSILTGECCRHCGRTNPQHFTGGYGKVRVRLPRAEGTLRCGGCRAVIYCNETCQKADWTKHKIECRTEVARCAAADRATGILPREVGAKWSRRRNEIAVFILNDGFSVTQNIFETVGMLRGMMTYLTCQFGDKTLLSKRFRTFSVDNLKTGSDYIQFFAHILPKHGVVDISFQHFVDQRLFVRVEDGVDTAMNLGLVPLADAVNPAERIMIRDYLRTLSVELNCQQYVMRVVAADVVEVGCHGECGGCGRGCGCNCGGCAVDVD
jgi:hypothetical protein